MSIKLATSFNVRGFKLFNPCLKNSFCLFNNCFIILLIFFFVFSILFFYFLFFFMCFLFYSYLTILSYVNNLTSSSLFLPIGLEFINFIILNALSISCKDTFSFVDITCHFL